MALKQWHKKGEMATIDMKMGWNYDTDFYIVDRYFTLYLSVFVFLFHNFYLWQYLQNSDTCNTVMSQAY